jgi:hypothetical protein
MRDAFHGFEIVGENTNDYTMHVSLVSFNMTSVFIGQGEAMIMDDHAV